MVVYNVGYYKFGLSNSLCVFLAWIFSVIFAFVTNKNWVFFSKSKSASKNAGEFIKFVGCRVTTGIADWFIMWVLVDGLNMTAWIIKTVSNVVVVILNYIFSKKFVFNKKRKGGV